MAGRLVVAVLVISAFAAVAIVGWKYLAPTGLTSRAASQNQVQSPAIAVGLLDVLGASDVAGFERAIEPRRFRFPQDHGPHLGFRTEWWYVTGLLEGPNAAKYGFQLTFFRLELSPGLPPAARPQLYLAHFSVTDITRGAFHAFERTGRADLGSAGARAAPFEVFLDHWSLRAEGDMWRLHASNGKVALDLELEARSPIVLQGDEGLSRKGAPRGAASYYYSVPNWTAKGSLYIDTEGAAIGVAGPRQPIPVTGAAWLDREWSTSALGAGQAGWDWFGLRLDDGRALMYYQLRKRDGSVDPHSSGSILERDGTVRRLRAGEVNLEVTDYWESADGVRYPARWRIEISGGPELEVVPWVADQRWRGTFRYWEGAVRVRGIQQGEDALGGEGYVELTGYER